MSGDTTWLGDGGLKLGGTGGHLRLPDNIMQGLRDITVSTQVWIDPSQATPYFIWGFGNTTNGAGNGYLFTTGNAYRTSIASGNWSTEQTASAGRNVDRGQWRTLTYTLCGGVGIIYEDGVEVGRKTGITITPGSIGGGTTTANYLGRSNYTSDRYLKGQVRDFRVYDRAITPDEARQLGAQTAGLRVASDAAALSLGDTSAVTDNLPLRAGGAGGSTISWASSNEAVVGYATATSPLGDDLVNRGEILTKDPALGILGTGHHSVVHVPGTDDWYIAYHRFAIPGGHGTHREVTIDRMRYNSDGTIARVVPTLESIAPLC